MKKATCIMILVLLLVCSFATAQKADEKSTFRTVFRTTGVSDWGIMIGPGFAVTNVVGKPGFMLTHRLELNVDRVYTVGFTFQHMPIDISFEKNWMGVDSAYYFRMSQFGINLRYSFFRESPVHLAIPLMFGGGFSTITKDKEAYNYDPYSNNNSTKEFVESSSYVAAEPGLMFDVDAGSALHFEFGLTYRFCFGSALQRLNEEDLNGMSFKISMKFGRNH